MLRTGVELSQNMAKLREVKRVPNCTPESESRWGKAGTRKSLAAKK